MGEQCQIDVWIEAAKGGDQSALTKLMAAFHPHLRRRAEARMDPAIRANTDPDDILQAVYVDLARRIDRFEDRGPDSFRNWLYAILDQKLVDLQRAAHRQKRDADRQVTIGRADSSSYCNLLDHVYANSGTPSRVARRQEALSALPMGLSDLSESHRQVIQLRFLEGLSVAEVAARLGKSEAAVVALTKRALEALRQSMDQLGEFTHGV
jgi:RNA polymerase sigma-70 factor (ECF subfamily)